MAKQERRTDVEHLRALAPGGAEATVTAAITQLRVQYLDATWSEWQVESINFNWGRIPLNLLEDGDWETVEPSPRRLTRLP